MTHKISNNTIWIGLGLGLLFIVMVVAMYYTFVIHAPGANDFYPRWKGAQLFWQDGIDPYSDEATAAIQQGMYGRLAYPTEDQVLFVYPFYTVFFLLPLVGISYSWVQAIWLVLLIFSIVIGTILTLKLISWQTSTWMLALVILWSIVLYNGTRTIILGQFAGLIFVWFIGSLVALHHGKDASAAVLLALTTIKPQMSFLIIPALLLWGVGQRRWRFVGAFLLSMTLLAGVSFLLSPRWLFDFINQVTSYSSYTVVGSPIFILTRVYWPQLGRPVELLLFAGFSIYLLYYWWKLPRLPIDSAQFLMVICVTLVVTNLLVSQTATTNYIMMYLPILWTAKHISMKWKRGEIVTAATLLLMVIGMWALFLSTIADSAENSVMFLPLPFGLLLVLLFGRRWLLAGSVTQ
ncbi:MAG: DUF2029 domain-containing protein [Chloroflexi bacterium]|nr:DUF2029 domain-containing protein [Chloroflexota bacterium]